MSIDIQRLRKSVALSQQRLARRSGISRARLQLHESGFIALSPEEIAKVMAVVRHQPKELAAALKVVLTHDKEERSA